MKLKHIIIVFLIVVLLPTTVLAGSGQFSLTQVYYPILSNGQNIDTQDHPILNLQGSTYLPVRALSEALGIPIIWDDTAKQVKITTCDPAKLAESCVEIYVGNGSKDVEQGSGVIIGYDTILSCAHVTSRGTVYRALYNGTSTTGCSLVKSNSTLDISTIKPINTDVKPCKIGDSDDVKIGDKVVLISSPKEKKNVISWGEVKSFDTYKGINGFSSTAQDNFGSSGGALFNAKGELIGIDDAGNGTTCFIIPINDIRKALSN